jgi:hypothetical protein
MGTRREAAVRVMHRHRIGSQPEFMRISELSFNGRCPVAVLTWLHEGGARIPGVCVELDPTKLRRARARLLFLYDGITADPRF